MNLKTIRIYLGFVLMIGFANTYAQDISSTVFAEITVCDEADTFAISYINDTGVSLTNQNITIGLPTGISYVSGSVTEQSSFNVQESNVSDNANLIFSANNLPVGQTIEFYVLMEAQIPAIAHQSVGNTFRNSVTVNHDNGSQAHTSAAYNPLFAALNIINIDPNAIDIASGESYNRNITVVNAGNGLVSEFMMIDERVRSGLDLNTVNWGTLSGTPDTITLSAPDFNSVGNGNNFFNTNELITIRENLTGSGCEDVTVTSRMQLLWGCNNEYEISSNFYANTTIDYETPNISVSPTSGLISCFGAGEPSPQVLTLSNGGAGFAQQLQLDLFKATSGSYDEDIFSRIDQTSITYQIESGSQIAVTPTSTFSTRNDGEYSCLGSNPIGRVILDLPDLPAGEDMIIRWNTYNCNISTCLGQNNTGWNYDLNYTDGCESTIYNESDLGEDVTDTDMSLFTESPHDIDDGERLEFRYTVSSHTNELPVGTGAAYELTFTLPAGLKVVNLTNDLIWSSGPTNWTPTSTNYNTSTKEVTATYQVPEPFIINKSEIQLFLTADCSEPGATDGEVSIQAVVGYIPDNTCASSFSVPMVCDLFVSTNLHCVTPGLCEGMSYDDFVVNRTSFGQPDNDQNGIADGSGSLDMNNIKLNRSMFGDTLRAEFWGTVATSGTNPTWQYGYASSDIELGTNLTSIGATVRVYDASSTSYIECPNVVVTSNTSGNDRTFDFDFSPATIAASCASFSGFQFDDGDSVWVYADYEVTGNIGGDVQEIDFLNEYYLSNTVNPTNNSDKYQCDFYNGTHTLIGYYFINQKRENVTIRTCSREIRQSYLLSIGDCCDNYAGGNLFPHEYRNWANVNEARVVIPANYTFVSATYRQSRTVFTNSSTNQSVSVTPDVTNGNTLTFNLEQYYENNGGSILLSDDGFEGRLSVEIAPTCDVPVNTFQEMPSDAKFTQTDFLGGGITDWVVPTRYDRVRYSPTDLLITSGTPIIDGLEKTITWNLRVKNNTTKTDADNAWVHIVSPTGDVQVTELKDLSSGSAVALSGDIYQIGSINRGQTRQFEITASYSACSPDFITVYSGYECSGYPANFADFECIIYETDLIVEPKPAQLQVTIDGNSVGAECNTEVRVELEVASTKLAVADSISIKFTLPSSGSITAVGGSGQFKYPLSESFQSLSDPAASGNEYTYNIWELNSYIEGNGLPGVLKLDSNRFQISYNFNLENSFRPGDFIQATIIGTEPCGDTLTTINLAYDPSVKFDINTSAGLTSDIGDSWSAAWVDYDGDGFEDLFVTEYDNRDPNFLYRNNGNGTFSRVISGDMATDNATSIASTWADADNDGDLDVFVANHIGTENFFYTGNGDGTFTKVTSGDIVSHDGYNHTPSWIDYDNDGNLDLFVSDFFPTQFNKLYHGNGDGTFTEVNNTALTMEAGYSVGSTWADYDNDGDVDLFVPNTEDENNSLFRNDGNGSFFKITTGSLVSDGGNSVGSSWGDYDNDGDLDLFVANAGPQANFLYNNNGDGTFTRVTSGDVVNDVGQSHGSAWVDFNNDGHLDLFVTNNQNESNFLYTNNGDGTFTKYENAINSDTGSSFGTAWGDPDNDGDLDLFVAQHSDQANAYYTNQKGNCNGWSCVNLEGTNSNRSAIGAKVRMKATIYGESVWQMREISAQTGGGAGGQGTLKAMFGLGDATSIDSIIVEWPSGFKQYLTNQSTGGCIDIVEESGNMVCGNIYYDENGNSTKDGEEIGIPNTLVEILPGPVYTVTDNNGDYRTYLSPGAYTINQVLSDDWNQLSPVSPSSHSITVVEGNTYCNNDFADSPLCTSPDLEVRLETTALRRGFQNSIIVQYLNHGATDATNGVLDIQFENDINIISSEVPWDAVAVGPLTTTYSWNIGDIEALSDSAFTLVDSVSQSASLGNFANIDATISMTETDCSLVDNDLSTSGEIVGSLDPNDKRVFPRGVGPDHMVMADDTLTYMIRFQNVGTFYASRVIIIDTLSNNLDLRSIEFVSSSHPFNMSLRDHILKWEANGIYLPDSATDEVNSHGYVKFKISPLNNLPDGTTVTNSASIQFDFNEYLITNSVFNTVVLDLGANGNEVILYPNPAAEFINLRLITNRNGERSRRSIERVRIHDDLGRIHRDITVGSRFPNIKIGDLKTGFYQVSVMDDQGLWFHTKLIKK